LKRNNICLVAKRDKIAKRIDGFLAQPEVGRAAAITFVDFIHVQLLNFGCKNKQKGHSIRPKNLRGKETGN
jgi:hypothetical protein